MTDPIVPSSPEPTPAAQPNPYAAPAAASVSGAPAKSPVLSILSLVAGAIGVLGGAIVFIPFVGGILQLFIPGAAVVLGFLGKKKEPQAAKGLWMTGIVLGFVGLAFAVLSIIMWAALFAANN